MRKLQIKERKKLKNKKERSINKVNKIGKGRDKLIRSIMLSTRND